MPSKLRHFDQHLPRQRPPLLLTGPSPRPYRATSSRNSRPCMLAPCSLATASMAWASCLYRTKAKPRKRPVLRSLGMKSCRRSG